MIKNFKLFVIMLSLISMTIPAMSAQPVKYMSSNIQTFVQADDEIFELEGEEGDFDEYVDETATTNNVKEKGASKVGDIITYILLGIILIAFLYGFYWLRHNNVTMEKYPILYTSLKVSKFSAIIGFIACITFMICQFGLHLSDLYTWLIIGVFGLIIVLYAIYKSYKSYAVLDSTGKKVTVTIVSIALGLVIGYSLLYLGIAVVALYVIWYAVKDKLGFDKYVLSDGTEIKRINSFSSQYRDSDGNTWERTSDGAFVKI